MSMGAPLPRSVAFGPGQRSANALSPTATRGAAGADNSSRLHSDQLFGQAQEVEIAHGDAIYRLRRTSLGKLILTK